MSGGRGDRASEPSALAGKLFDESGVPLTPSHAVKSGRRYRYYISCHLVTGPTDQPRPENHEGWRLPAREIEHTVADAVTALLVDRTELADAARDSGLSADQLPKLLTAAAGWKGESVTLVERVDLAADEISIAIDLSRLVAESHATIRHAVATRFKRRGVEMRLILEGRGSSVAVRSPDPALIKAVARAHKWFDDLVTGRVRTLGDVARAEGCHKRYVGRLLPLAFLPPDIVEAILDGTQPVDLTAETLTRHAGLPLTWTEQRALLGFE